MKNSIYLIIAIIAVFYFANQGKKISEIESEPENRSFLKDVKLGFGSTLDRIFGDNKAPEDGEVRHFSWQPSYMGERMPDYVMENLNDPRKSCFNIDLLPRRGSFMHPIFRDAIYDKKYLQ